MYKTKKIPLAQGVFHYMRRLCIAQKISTHCNYKAAPVSGKKVGRLIVSIGGITAPHPVLFIINWSLILSTLSTAAWSTAGASVAVVTVSTMVSIVSVVVTTVRVPPVVSVVVVVEVVEVVQESSVVLVVVVVVGEDSAATPSSHRPS